MHRRSLAIALITALAAAAGCRGRGRVDEGPFDVAPLTFNELRTDLLDHPPRLEHFDQRGPLPYRVVVNRALRVGTETVVADLALPDPAAKAPLVIITHGNHSRKEAHRYQIERLASFGMFAMALQLPNNGRWIDNGLTIGKLVRKLRERPELIDRDVDPDAIILAGHSFGGSAITVAAGSGAPVKGLILLDPAVVADGVKDYMRKAVVPAALIGADRRIFRSRKRRAFFRNLGGETLEVSVRGATHDDAQHPSMFAISALGVDPFTSRDRQEVFSAAITATAFSLGATGGLGYAWKVIQQESGRAGELTQAKRRAPRAASRERGLQQRASEAAR